MSSKSIGTSNSTSPSTGVAIDSMGEPAGGPTCAPSAGVVTARLGGWLALGRTAMPFGFAGLLTRLGGLFGGFVEYGNACLEDVSVLAVWCP